MNSIVDAIPTLLLFKDGKVVDRAAGLRGKRHLKATMDKVLANRNSTWRGPGQTLDDLNG